MLTIRRPAANRSGARPYHRLGTAQSDRKTKGVFVPQTVILGSSALTPAQALNRSMESAALCGQRTRRTVLQIVRA